MQARQCARNLLFFPLFISSAVQQCELVKFLLYIHYIYRLTVGLTAAADDSAARGK